MEDLRAVKVIKAVLRYYLKRFANPQAQLTGEKDFCGLPGSAFT